jgi:hypothetical protein
MVRVAGLRALGKLGQQIPLEYLLLALKDSEWEVREMAILVLGEMKTQLPNLLQSLLKAAQFDPHTQVRDIAAQTLDQYEVWSKSTHRIAEQPATYNTHIHNPAFDAYAHSARIDTHVHNPAFNTDAHSPETEEVIKDVSQIQVQESKYQYQETQHQQATTPLRPEMWKTFLLNSQHRLKHYRLVGQRQFPLIHKSIWISAPLAILMGYLCAIFSSQHNAAAYLALFTTLSAAISAAFIYGGENDAGLELTLTTPTSIRFVMFWRFVLVIGYNLLLSAIASVGLALLYNGGLLQIIQFWLGPVMLLSSIALTLSFLVSSWFALVTALLIEASQVFAFSNKHILPMPDLSLTITTHWQTNPFMLIAALLVFLIALYYAPYRPGLRNP